MSRVHSGAYQNLIWLIGRGWICSLAPQRSLLYNIVMHSQKIGFVSMYYKKERGEEKLKIDCQ